jgi:ABC-type glucose/galactose transport system permease subunit
MDAYPETLWAIDLNSEGVLLELIENIYETSAGWTGWGFLLSSSRTESATGCLLFEYKEDATMAKLAFGEKLYAN